MTPEQGSNILRNLGKLSGLYPSWRFCQMVANVGVYAGADSPAKLAVLTDDEFADAVTAAVEGRERSLDGERPLSFADDTLAPLLPSIVRGLVELSASEPERSLVALIRQVAEWTKGFAPFDFWDVEDVDFLRAIQAHLAPVTAAQR